MKIEDILKDILKEINRITTEAHPDFGKNDMGKWIEVIGEEFGEICRAINDKEGKNLYTESIQLISATILMLKKAEKLKLLED